MKLLLIMPATNASSERSFSALRKVKNYDVSTEAEQSHGLSCSKRAH